MGSMYGAKPVPIRHDAEWNEVRRIHALETQRRAPAGLVGLKAYGK